MSTPSPKWMDRTACLAAIDADDAQIQAWELLDRDGRYATSAQTGPLQGAYVGIKDIIDVANMGCRYGSAIFEERVAQTDAELVHLLKQAGAVILGKTVTTEFAYMHISKTRNPHNLLYSPGGSSSGSAAAVGAGHIDLAVGTQTGGSVIRPASYCGVHAFKPTFATISRKGVLQTSQTLDQVGIFARNLEQLALFGSVIMDQPEIAQSLFVVPDSPPKFLYLDRLYGDEVADYVHAGLRKIAESLPEYVDIKPAPDSDIARYLDTHKVIYDYEINQNIGPFQPENQALMSLEIKQAIQRGRQISEKEYNQACIQRIQAQAFFDQLLDGYDGLITSSSPAQAPLFEKGTGNSVCNCLWSLCGFPAINLPLSGPYSIKGPAGLGVGVQLISATGRDAALLAIAQWLEARLS